MSSIRQILDVSGGSGFYYLSLTIYDESDNSRRTATIPLNERSFNHLSRFLRLNVDPQFDISSILLCGKARTTVEDWSTCSSYKPFASLNPSSHLCFVYVLYDLHVYAVNQSDVVAGDLPKGAFRVFSYVHRILRDGSWDVSEYLYKFLPCESDLPLEDDRVPVPIYVQDINI